MLESNLAALPRPSSLPEWLRAELRSDHAGETGAVWLYIGILRWSRNPEVIAFATEHLETERRHLGHFEAWLSAKDKSMLTPLWRLAGFILGSLAVFGGAHVVYLTIEVVETFVIEHYRQQIEKLDQQRAHPEVAETLRQFMQDEAEHCHDAAGRHAIPDAFSVQCWRSIVTIGSEMAVTVAKKL
ncbi:MAG: demethoxyubiquinone hydroxylase family protein [Gammaproteobacteria bacterium]|jgi:ubiquinone biosynthesis monooxygenase Coq7|nr:demethoxyubiquinone hydroxylase family protein [Gammaproteobacteria bacterium]